MLNVVGRGVVPQVLSRCVQGAGILPGVGYFIEKNEVLMFLGCLHLFNTNYCVRDVDREVCVLSISSWSAQGGQKMAGDLVS